MEDDPLGSGSVSGSTTEPASAQSNMDALRRALEQGNAPTVSEVNSFLRLCETQEVSSETIAKVEQLLGDLKKSGFRMKEVKAAYGALKAMEARKAAQNSSTGTSMATPAKSPPTPAKAPSTAYSSALGVNIPATRRPQSKDTKTTPAAAGRPKTPKAAPGEATLNEAGFRQGDKVVFAPFCPHRDRGVGTVVFSSHSGICVAFDSGGQKGEEWIHNEIVARPGSAQRSASTKSTGGTSAKQKDEGQSFGWLGSAPAPAPAARAAADEDML